jgi:hypothetical protein
MLLWIAVMILMFFGVGVGLPTIFGRSLPEAWITFIQTASAFVYIFVSIKVLFVLIDKQLEKRQRG